MAFDAVQPRARQVEVAIIGAGFAGLGMAIRLKQAGIDDFTVIEREADVGGTWYVNRYPGCGCDVQSHLYSLSFAPNPDWSRMFATQPEILAYLKGCADRYGVRRHLRLSTEVRAARWDAGAGHWAITLSSGETISARVLVAATGGLSRPSIPQIEGLTTFDGPVFHSQQWDHSVDLHGKRVAVIGTGASAIQFVPEIAPDVAQLDLYQRTPPWVLPKPDRPISLAERLLYRASDRARRAQRNRLYWQLEARALAFVVNPRLLKIAERDARRHLRRQVPERALRARLTPDYAIGCKRVLISDNYYPAVCRDNVDVVTHGIDRVTAGGVVEMTGVERRADALIFGTGFQVANPLGPLDIQGVGGLSIHDAWSDRPKAHLGMTVPDFPNLFVMVGPNTGLAHNSIVHMIESQIAYILDALQTMQARDIATVNVRQGTLNRFDADVQARSRGTVWTSGGCASWYLDAQGNNFSLWPGFTWQYRRRTRRFRSADFDVVYGRSDVTESGAAKAA